MMCGNYGRNEGDCERCRRPAASCTIKERITNLEKENKRLIELLHMFSICETCGGSWGKDCPDCKKENKNV